jgi:hypothetical protein
MFDDISAALRLNGRGLGYKKASAACRGETKRSER